MQSPVLEVMTFTGSHEERPYETYISDLGGELDVSLHRAAARGDVAEISRGTTSTLAMATKSLHSIAPS